MNEPCADHEVLTRWEHDPAALTYSRRCARCGVVARRLTQRELDTLPALDVPTALEFHRAKSPKALHLRQM